MKKSIVISTGGKNARVAELLVNRLIPGNLINKIGPFVLLDHIYPAFHKSKELKSHCGKGAHPLRGIATFSYLLSGGLEHVDSYNHHAIIQAGGAEWMNAGNGIIRNERPSPEFLKKGGVFHSLQFWINLPAEIKNAPPDFLSLAASAIPEGILPNEAGVIRILLGNCCDLTSPFNTFSKEFIFHLQLNPKSEYTMGTKDNMEYAVFVPSANVRINDELTGSSHMLVFSRDNLDISVYNPGIGVADIFVFGGEEYTEPIVAEGPFVMNSHKQIVEAYHDFYEGKYGVIPIPVENVYKQPITGSKN